MVMMVPLAADSFSRLRRVVALLEAGRPLPADVRAWLAAALARIVAGDDPAAVLGVTRAAVLAHRDDTLRRLAAHAPGGVTARARSVAGWLDGDTPAPPAAAPLLADVRDAPGWRQILRVLRGSRSGDAVPLSAGFDTAGADGVMAAWLRRPAVPAKGKKC